MAKSARSLVYRETLGDQTFDFRRRHAIHAELTQRLFAARGFFSPPFLDLNFWDFGPGIAAAASKSPLAESGASRAICEYCRNQE